MNNVRATCPFFNCDYVINEDLTPSITQFSIETYGLSLTLKRPAGSTKVYTPSDLDIKFGGS